MRPFFATPYNIDRHWSARFATENHAPSLTQQSDAAESDINIIMARYGATGQVPQVQMEALTGDFSEVGDYRTAVERIRQAEEAFANVPADIRKRFNNDAQTFIDYAMDPKNIDELRKMGLANPAPTPETNPTPTPGEGGNA